MKDFESKEFKQLIKKAIHKAIYEDYSQGGDNSEIYFDSICEDTAVENVIKTISEYAKDKL